MIFLFYIYLFINIAGFLLMWRDKRLAQAEGGRIAERTIFMTALFGGAVGCWAGMKIFRHKTRYWRFSLGLPLIFILQAAAVIYILL